MIRKPIAHVLPLAEGGFITHDLAEHLSKVASRAATHAATFGANDWASVAGIWHDLGKYNEKFQHYIKTASGYDTEAHIEVETQKGKVNHSDAGAQYAVEQFGVHGRILAYLIAGHHAGLPDWHKLDAPGGSLQQRLLNTDNLKVALVANIPLEILGQARPTTPIPGGRVGFALWVRMLFSCLVDADFLDTEEFMDEEKSRLRSRYPQFAELLPRFDEHMSALAAQAASTSVNRLRTEILNQCRQMAQQSPGIFSLTVPTGGGKTLSSMAFALEHAKLHQHRRVIYAIPYTSIIEQTADVLRNIFPGAVVEHHSNIDPEDAEKETSKSRLATENWDAPIIVTTNVQFFESLFAARTSRCRKLHNIANSIVILDEAQLLPPEFLQPILSVINLLSQHYGVTFVFSTATQPALTSQTDNFGNTLLKGLENVKEIITDPDQLYRQLERVEVTMPDDFNASQSWEEIARQLQQYDSVLAIVNTRPGARELHGLMPKGTYHLSGLMCGQHRSEVIAEIKNRQGQPIRVVSTQLVEAGVDLDFPVVYRAMAGLDSIAQAAGRCNREGRLPEKGKVVVFVAPTPAPPGMLRRAEQTTVSLMTEEARQNPLERRRFQSYFEHFYSKTDLDKYDIQGLLKPDGSGDDSLKVQFRTAAQRFQLIDESDYQAVIVRYGDTVKDLITRLEQLGPERWLMRKLQRYTVNISHFHLESLLDSQDIREIHPGIYMQVSDTLYHSILGLSINPTTIEPSQTVI
ncbi:MAG: CRISPR-associated helicase Cas3' [Gammaproteobacteria bacterium]|nr:CRISPR-associated helicase Cas3' [Gammaproteobacteria bacterium]MBQ0839973.1 CRISPR-associated helicase Cas3' [Gammaproteobacteria bacterium]